MYPKLAKDLDFDIRHTGTLVVAYSDKDLLKVDELLDNARVNGVAEVEKIDARQLQNREPHINPAAVGALLAHTTTMIDPFEVAIAFAENAKDNGTDIFNGTGSHRYFQRRGWPLYGDDKSRSFQNTLCG